jgi:hypothetical protein
MLPLNRIRTFFIFIYFHRPSFLKLNELVKVNEPNHTYIHSYLYFSKCPYPYRSRAGLPDDLLSNPKSQFGKKFKILGMEKVGTYIL